ncbi:MAG: deoxyribonuclease IV [Lachnospiraceae bacterium]|nr:deoxyribonuclease IV [Lachnospiraceae bacterium]
MYIGSHISASKGYEAMGRQALVLGANTFAFFTRNPRGGKAKDIQEDDVKAYLSIAKEHDFGPVVAHAPYTMNPCAAKPELRQFAREMFLDDMMRMEYIPGNYYNLHPGSHVSQGVDVAVPLIAQMLNDCMKPEQSTIVLLETMAGKGSEVGRNFEELKMILDMVKPELQDKLGICLDTCHVWDGGYDIVNHLDDVLQEFDRIIGLERLKAVHLNDSMNDLGSHKDRHEKIGKGKIGMDAFERIINHPALRDLPFILETPNDDQGWAEEIRILKEKYK